MIIRKPYAFLIKRFRIIHLILAFLTAYLAYKTTNIVGFFREFASHSIDFISHNLAVEYINFFMYGAVLLVLIISIAILFLMYFKQKKTKFYGFLILYYFLIFVMLSFAYNILSTIPTEIVTSQSARFYRDISLLIYLPQYFFIASCLMRGFGFNIKKFNFDRDLERMDTDEEDREEIEVALPLDNYKAKRSVRRFFREFGYYAKENKFILFCIITFMVITVGTSMYLNRSVYRKEYTEGKPFSYRTFTLTNLDSIVTNMDTRGNEIGNGKYYLLVNFRISSRMTRELQLTDFRLMVDNKVIFPTLNRREHFIDFGFPYSGRRLHENTEDEYMLVFELEPSQVKRRYRLRILDNITYGIGTITPSYKDLILRPTRVDQMNVRGNFKLNNEIAFRNTPLKNTRLTVLNYTITDSYRYVYEHCFQGDCRSFFGSATVDRGTSGRNTLIAIDYDLTIDQNTYFSRNIRHDRFFFINFARIRYTVDGEKKEVDIRDRTPNQVENVFVMQVPREIMNATSIELLINIRNQQYVIKLL